MALRGGVELGAMLDDAAGGAGRVRVYAQGVLRVEVPITLDAEAESDADRGNLAEAGVAWFGCAEATRDRAARTGRNPRTGEAVAIAASRVPGFKAGKALRDAVNE